MRAAVGEKNALDQALVVLRRRWALVFLCGALTGMAAVAFSLHQRPDYTASASLLFGDPQSNQNQDLFGGTATPAPNTDPTQQAATNLGLVSLPIIASKTASDLHTTATVVRSEVSVSAVGLSAMVNVTVTDPSPVRAAQIANTYAHQYIAFRQQAARAKLNSARGEITNDLAILPAAQRLGPVGRSLQARSNQLRLLAALQTGDAELVQSAAVPSSPSSPSTKRNAVLGVLLGLLVGVGLAFAAARFDRRIRDPSELEDAYGVPLLGAVPTRRSYGAMGRSALLPSEAQPFALLRARLRYFNVDRDVRSLLVTSATVGEGKTTVALGLAIAEAAAGKSNVVLVEADLRRPVLASRLGINAMPGLAEILSWNYPMEAAMRELAVPGSDSRTESRATFTLIPAGAQPPNPAELLESRAMIELLSSLSQRFDLVVIDTPSASAVPDAMPLLGLVNGTVIVARMNRTTRDAARQLREQLEKLQSPTLGVVATAVAAKSRRHYYDGDQQLSASPSGTDLPFGADLLPDEMLWGNPSAPRGPLLTREASTTRKQDHDGL
jgi:capsular exopolysaccharide synthesis family protein